jgi:hypothetical protein
MEDLPRNPEDMAHDHLGIDSRRGDRGVLQPPASFE